MVEILNFVDGAEARDLTDPDRGRREAMDRLAIRGGRP